MKSHADRILAQMPAHRLVAVDALRGLAIAAMVLVNNPGSWSYIYAPLKHADWHGWTPTDVIFPLFLYVVGLSIVLANGSAPSFSLPGKAHWQRTIKLFGLGLFLAVFFWQPFNENYSWWHDQVLSIRWLGVLQRIALVYIASCYLAFLLERRGLILVCTALMILPYLASLIIPVSDSAGVVYRGQLGFGQQFGAWLDQTILGREHLYYKNAQPFAFDPEGLLSTLPAIATCLLGVLAGLSWRQVSTHKGDRKHLIQRWALFGVAFLLVGQLLYAWVPINKALWTPSFVLVTAGVAQLLLAGIFFCTDYHHWRRWFSPLLVFGVNAIALFMLAGIVGRMLVIIPVSGTSLKGYIYAQWLSPFLDNYFASLIFSVLCLVAFYRLLWWMYQRRIIWKV